MSSFTTTITEISYVDDAVHGKVVTHVKANLCYGDVCEEIVNHIYDPDVDTIDADNFIGYDNITEAQAIAWFEGSSVFEDWKRSLMQRMPEPSAITPTTAMPWS